MKIKNLDIDSIVRYPIMFADKCIAKDGHICDSIAEKILVEIYPKDLYPKNHLNDNFGVLFGF